MTYDDLRDAVAYALSHQPGEPPDADWVADFRPDAAAALAVVADALRERARVAPMTAYEQPNKIAAWRQGVEDALALVTPPEVTT